MSLRYVVMGVAGSGKTTLGAAFAKAIGARFVEGDSLHSAANRAKMTAGTPLTDDDRWPWLDAVAAELKAEPLPVVAACSALRRAYRDRLRAGAGGEVVFLHPYGPKAMMAGRIASRKGHFMPASLADSQYAALEPLESDEAGFTLDATLWPRALLAEALRVTGRG